MAIERTDQADLLCRKLGQDPEFLASDAGIRKYGRVYEKHLATAEQMTRMGVDWRTVRVAGDKIYAGGNSL